jgi:ubiquinone/menaquinone biosynthesis C-methylase UbiE
LSQRQTAQATRFAKEKNLENLVSFTIMDYCNTDFNDESFHVVWGCESICYADDKEKFIKEAYRILKPGGSLIIADGFVTSFENNQQPVIRKWLDGWQVNYLETPERFLKFLQNAGFVNTTYKNISKEAARSSQRLYRFYFLAKMYLAWKKINFSKPATEIQKKNIDACKYQYLGMKKDFGNMES